MMHDQPNNPEYCQGIYEAAKDATELYEIMQQDLYKGLRTPKTEAMFEAAMANLKRALEGKP